MTLAHRLLSSMAIVAGASGIAFAQSPAAPTEPTPAPVTQAAESPVPAAPQAVTEPEAATVAPREQAFADFDEVKDFRSLDLSKMVDATGEYLDKNVETATRNSQRISRAPAIIEVLTRSQLYELGARDLYTALTFLPGIQLIQAYTGTQTLVFRGQLQENYNSKILLLINGQPTYEPVSSEFYLELIPLEAIDRIEVIRGPGSVLYGTNAYAGVINILTTERDVPGTSKYVRAEGGSFRTGSLGAGVAGKHNTVKWSLFASGQGTKGYPYRIRNDQNEDCVAGDPNGAGDCNPDGTSRVLDYYNNFVNAYGSARVGGLQLQAAGMFQDRMKYGIAPVVRYNGQDQTRHVFVGASYGVRLGDWTWVARSNLDRDQRSWQVGEFPSPAFGKSSINGMTTVMRGELSSKWAPVREFEFTQGVLFEIGRVLYYRVEDEDGRSHPLAADFEHPLNRTLSWYGQATWEVTGRIALIAGDRVSRFQTSYLDVRLPTSVPVTQVKTDDAFWQNSPRAGLIYTPADDLTVKLLYGEAFRLPNLYETGAFLNQIVGTTSGIGAETIRTTELGVDTRPVDKVSVRANVYYSLTDDLIGRRPPTTDEALRFGGTATVYDNLAGQEVFGGELGLRALMSQSWNWFANLSATRVYNREPVRAVRDVAPLTGNIGTSYSPLSWLALRPNVQYVGPRAASKSFALANLVIDFPILQEVTLSAIGTNLTDKQYTYPESVRPIVATLPGGAGRAFYGRLVADF